MKTKQVTVYEGEYLGPVDWKYDFKQHDWDHGGCCNPKHIEKCIERLNILESHKKFGIKCKPPQMEDSRGLDGGKFWRLACMMDGHIGSPYLVY